MANEKKKTTRVLCIDHEGGSGGSSRSLFESLLVVDRKRVEPTLWCRRKSDLLQDYAAAGIATRVLPEIPSFTPLERSLPSLIDLGFAARNMLRFRYRYKALLEKLDESFDVIHLNHENMFLLARQIRQFSALPITMHIRTIQFDTALSRWQTSTISKSVDHLFFISKNEQRTFQARLGRQDRQEVLTNIARKPGAARRHPKLHNEGRLLVASIANFSLEHGVDRLVELAVLLKEKGRRDIHFAIAGKIELSRGTRRSLGPPARNARNLADYAAARQVSDYFTFLGHVSNVPSVLSACDAVIKLNRLGSNWGRDVIEALCAGKPIIAIGEDHTFIQPGKTGYLFPDFNASQICDRLIHLRDNPAVLSDMAHNSLALAKNAVDSDRHGAALTDRWCSLRPDNSRNRSQ